MPMDLTDHTSTLVQVMAWCCQATSHYWANVDPDLCCHMASLGHNELYIYQNYLKGCGKYCSADCYLVIVNGSEALHMHDTSWSLLIQVMACCLRSPNQVMAWYWPSLSRLFHWLQPPNTSTCKGLTSRDWPSHVGYAKLPLCIHYNDVTWASSLATRVFVQQFIPANFKETSKVCISGPLWSDSTSDQ